MSVYALPIRTAFLVFVILSFILMLPWLIYTYRRDGFFSWWKFILSFSFIFYLLAALSLVLLPFPSTRNTCAHQSANTVYYSLIPFSFVHDMFKEASVVWSQPASYVQLVKGRAFLQTVFNFLLLFPFGVYIRYFFNNRKSWKRALLLGFSLSLFFEVTQLTGVFGYFNCPYRLFDVDDLMVNSSGTLCGFLIAPIVLALFPSSKSIEAKRERILEKDIVFPLPQLLALLIDYIVFQLVYLPLASLFSSDWLTDFVCASLTFVLVLYLVPLVWQGKTIGSAILRFRFLDKNTGKPFARSLFKRFLSLYLPWLLFHVLSAIGGIEIDQDSAFYPYQVWFNVGVLLFYFLFILVLFIHVILVVFSHGRRQFYFDYASGIRPSRRPQRPKENKHAT